MDHSVYRSDFYYLKARAGFRIRDLLLKYYFNTFADSKLTQASPAEDMGVKCLRTNEYLGVPVMKQFCLFEPDIIYDVLQPHIHTD